MKRLLACTLLVALPAISSAATTAGATSSPAPHVVAKPPVIAHSVIAHSKVAPADEYFGRLKMSILGIRNQIKDLGLKADMDPHKAAGIMGTALLTDDAVHDWQRKYPADSWIPGMIFALERLYAKVDSDEARSRAKATMVWLVHAYPSNNFARIGKRELGQNLVGVKPDPTPAPPEAAQVAPVPLASPAAP